MATEGRTGTPSMAPGGEPVVASKEGGSDPGAGVSSRLRTETVSGKNDLFTWQMQRQAMEKDRRGRLREALRLGSVGKGCNVTYQSLEQSRGLCVEAG